MESCDARIVSGAHQGSSDWPFPSSAELSFISRCTLRSWVNSNRASNCCFLNDDYDPLQCFLPSPFSFSSLLCASPPPSSSASSSASTCCLAAVSVRKRRKFSNKARRTPVDNLSSALGFLFKGNQCSKGWMTSTDEMQQNDTSWRIAFEAHGSQRPQMFWKDSSKRNSETNEAVGASERILCDDKGPNGRLNSLNAGKMSKHLLAGAMSAVVSRTIVAPLERLKLEYIVRGATTDVLDVMRRILATEGLKGFWKGNLVNLIRTAPFKSINFYAYDTIRKQITSISGRKEITNFERLAAGATAGIVATIICFPMDTIRTRMVAPGGEALGGIIGCFQHLISSQGLSSLYAGIVPALVSMGPAGAVFYGVYDILKTGYLTSPAGQEDLRSRAERAKRGGSSQDQMELGPLRTLLYGAIAGACAETVTYPFEVVRRHLQMQNAANRVGAFRTVQGLLEQGGVGALYAGLLPSTLQVLPSAALSYFVYEWLKLSLKVS